MTIHKSMIYRNWYVLDVQMRVVFRGSYDECQAFCEGK